MGVGGWGSPTAAAGEILDAVGGKVSHDTRCCRRVRLVVVAMGVELTNQIAGRRRRRLLGRPLGCSPGYAAFTRRT